MLSIANTRTHARARAHAHAHPHTRTHTHISIKVALIFHYAPISWTYNDLAQRLRVTFIV